MQPQYSSYAPNPFLTDFSKIISNNSADFVASKLFPRVPVKNKSGKYYIYGTENLLLSRSTRLPGTPFDQSGFTVSSDTYSCEMLGREHPIPDEERSEAAAGVNLEEDVTSHLTSLVDLELENRVASLINTTNITQYTTLSGTTQWTDYTTPSVPLTNIKTAQAAISAACGFGPNTILLPYTVALTLANHPAVVELRKYTDPKLINSAGLPNPFLGMNVLLANARYSSTKAGQTATLADLWGDICLLAYVNPNPSMRSITLGATFEYQGRAVGTYRNDPIKSDVVRVEEQGVAEKIINAGCAYLINDVSA